MAKEQVEGVEEVVKVKEEEVKEQPEVEQHIEQQFLHMVKELADVEEKEKGQDIEDLSKK